jgi:hypothetical protein
MKSQLKLTLGIFLLCAILLPSSSAFSSEIYRWKDKDGKIHYSDTPPPSGVDSEIKKFDEPQSREKSKPKVNPPQPKLDSSPPTGSEVRIKDSREEPVPTSKPRPQASSPLPPREAFKEKRPYGSIDVIMYMTSW